MNYFESRNNIEYSFGLKVPVLVYHNVDNTPWSDEVYFMPTNDMESQIISLRKSGYTFITFDDLPELKNIKKPVMLSFDDGYINNYTNLFPILKKYNAKATISLIFNSIDRYHYLTKSQIIEMNKSGLVSFQSHTMTHQALDELDDNLLEYEIKESQQRIAEIINRLPMALFYPFGRYSENVIKFTKKYYQFGLSAIPKCWVTGKKDYEIGRLFVWRGISDSELLMNLSSFIGDSK